MGYSWLRKIQNNDINLLQRCHGNNIDIRNKRQRIILKRRKLDELN